MQRLGLDREQLGELIAVVDLFNGMNRVADGYQLEADVTPTLQDWGNSEEDPASESPEAP